MGLWTIDYENLTPSGHELQEFGLEVLRHLGLWTLRFGIEHWTSGFSRFSGFFTKKLDSFGLYFSDFEILPPLYFGVRKYRSPTIHIRKVPPVSEYQIRFCIQRVSEYTFLENCMPRVIRVDYIRRHSSTRPLTGIINSFLRAFRNTVCTALCLSFPSAHGHEFLPGLVVPSLSSKNRTIIRAVFRNRLG